MSKLLGVRETLALLDEFKGIVREFAAAEEKLNRDLRNQTDSATKRFREDKTVQQSEGKEALQITRTRHDDARAGLESRHAARQARIIRAHKSSQRQARERIEQEEGARKYRVQKGLLDAKRIREEGLAQNDAAFADFTHQLVANRQQFEALEVRAQVAFKSHGAFKRLLANTSLTDGPDLAPDEYQLLAQLAALQERVASQIGEFEKLLLPALFRNAPLWLWLLLIVLVAGVASALHPRLALAEFSQLHVALGAGVLLVLTLLLYSFGKSSAASLAVTIANNLEAARLLHNASLEKAQKRHAREIERIETEAQARKLALERDWQTALGNAGAAREAGPGKVNRKHVRVAQHHERLYEQRRERLATHANSEIEALEQAIALRAEQHDESHRALLARFRSEYDRAWEQLAADWKWRTDPLLATLREAGVAAAAQFASWESAAWQLWNPPPKPALAIPFGKLAVDVRNFAEEAPQDPRLAFPSEIVVPLLLTYPEQGSILFETARANKDDVIQALNNILFRLLAASPPGKLSLTIIDPISLGQNFAGVMHLSDYEDNLINGRIWTQTTQIEQRLADLNEHMEKVIQMYLRNEYATIAQYNEQAGTIAEKYHFVVIADFPANFSETAARRLLHIATSGARCGVYTLIHWDHRQTAPVGFLPEELRQSSVCVSCEAGHCVLNHPLVPGARVLLEQPPNTEFVTDFLRRIGELSRGSNRVEVPFDQVAPPVAEVWSLAASDELRVPIGRSGATKLQYLALGQGTRQHVLIAGKTGSGKSTLLHVLITNLSLWYAPNQVEFYLVDFKKGVEFKAYATERLPHARVVAIESDREFGLSVLQRVDEELKRRGDLFRKLGVQDLAGYKRAGGSERMPRCLLIIDEFQEFFVEDDRIAQTANLLLDRIVRQGRAFGIHVILGSQTLGGAYTLARTTIGQMVVRIALQCNEADAYLIMDENNSAPRLLSRPGEGIYNDAAGVSEGNSPFQAVWLEEGEREARLRFIRGLADRVPETISSSPIVFEGNAPADVRENGPLRALLKEPTTTGIQRARAWFGAPNSIKGPTEVVFQSRSGNNLLIVGQRDEAVLAMLGAGLIALSAQFPTGTVRFVLLESTVPDSNERAFIERIVRAIPHQTVVAKPGDVASVLQGLGEELHERQIGEEAHGAVTFLIIHGLQNFRRFRQDDDFSFSLEATEVQSPAAQLQKIISEGPSAGMHVIASVDTFNNVSRFVGRKMLSEFELRILFQMSANDAASLADDPKASALGLHRALLYNEQEGTIETFRPYALPSAEWIQEATESLARLGGNNSMR